VSIDTKLRQAADSVRQARSHAEFTVTPPGTRSPLARGLQLAAIASVVALAVVGIPALVGLTTTSSPSGGAATTSGLPHLVLDLPDTSITDAYNIFDAATGAPIGAQTTYLMTLIDDADGWTGRKIQLRIQQPGTVFGVFDDLVASAESTESVTVAGRQVTVYLIPDEAIAEGSYDQGVLRWTEPPGYEAILIPWGMGPNEALQLLDSLENVSDYEWEQLAGAHDSSATTTTTIDADTGLDRPYLLDGPGWTLVRADSGIDASYASATYERPREGTRHPDRLLVGANVDAAVLADELAAATSGGPEWEGRVDGFGTPWSEPTNDVVDVSGRSVTLISFTDYDHMAFWVDETGAGILVTSDRSTRDEIIALIDELKPVTWDTWLRTTGGLTTDNATEGMGRAPE
jgi:hypothetical protein